MSEEILKKVKFEIVKLPVVINVSDYEISDLYADSYSKYIEITENDVKEIVRGRFSETAEIGYKQVYKTIEKKINKHEEWYSDGSSIYFLFKVKDKNVVVRADVFDIVEYYETNNFDFRERGKKPKNDDVILFEGTYSITSASSRTETYWMKREIFEILKEEAKKLV
jgi:hypothetical protein